MAKNCLNKLASNITVACTIPQVGVKDIYLMHAEDVKFAYHSDGLVSTAVFAGGAKSYKVEGYKQNIQVTASLKTTDASARVDSSVTFKIPYNYRNNQFINTLASGKFCVLAVFNDGGLALIGNVAPLECSSADFDSNANAGMVTITLASPEGSAGNSVVSISPTARDTIISKSV
nr:MAG TPA: hypothetical protein [Caudoviricetes sp.]